MRRDGHSNGTGRGSDFEELARRLRAQVDRQHQLLTSILRLICGAAPRPSPGSNGHQADAEQLVVMAAVRLGLDELDRPAHAAVAVRCEVQVGGGLQHHREAGVSPPHGLAQRVGRADPRAVGAERGALHGLAEAGAEVRIASVARRALEKAELLAQRHDDFRLLEKDERQIDVAQDAVDGSALGTHELGNGAERAGPREP